MTAQTDKLVKMAEQITANLAFTDDEAEVAARVADHLTRFWDPRMREALQVLASNQPASLSPTLRRAVAQLEVTSD